MKKLIYLLISLILVAFIATPAQATRNMGWAGPIGNVYENKTTLPGVNDDISAGYQDGDIWIDETNDAFYICVDSTEGAAVWNSGGSAFSGTSITLSATTFYASFGNTPTYSFTSGTSTGVGSTTGRIVSLYAESIEVLRATSSGISITSGIDVSGITATLIEATTGVSAPATMIEAYRYETIPVEWGLNGSTAPDAAEVIGSGITSTVVRTYDYAQTEDLIFNWVVPEDIEVGSGVSYQVLGVITNATGPTLAGMAFDLSGACVGDNDRLDPTLGTAVESAVTGTYTQYDHFETAWSTVVTVTNLAAGEMAKLKLERDHDDTDDTYGQKAGVSFLVLKYRQRLAN